MVQNDQKTGLNAVFAMLWSFGYSQIDPKRNTKAHKLTRCIAQCLDLKYRPISNHLAHSFRRNGKKQPSVRNAIFGNFGPYGHKALQAGCMAQCLSMKIGP
jgi:hypothetical protein